MDKITNFLINTPKVNPNRPINNASKTVQNNGVNFGDILNQKINESTELKFSKHAEIRLKDRNISLSEDQLKRINTAVEKANEKGVKDSLVLVDNIAMIVSIRNKTVVTVTDSNELKDNVFTNIDGAVII